MTLLPILYALLAALTGFSAEGATPLRDQRVAAASALAVEGAEVRIAVPARNRADLAALVAGAAKWRDRSGLGAPLPAVAAETPLPMVERPARRRE